MSWVISEVCNTKYLSCFYCIYVGLMLTNFLNKILQEISYIYYMHQ